MRFLRVQAWTLLAAALLSGGAQAQAALKLDGLDPQHYMQRRNHLPDVSAELAGLPLAQLERVLQGKDIVYAADDAYPASLKPAERAAWRAKETRAVKLGALLALSRHAAAHDGDRAAVAAIVGSALADADVKVAVVAAERLGDVRAQDAVAVLGAIALSDADVGVRAGACAGLGRVRDEAAAIALADVVRGADNDDVKVAAIIAMQQVGSSWAWSARKEDARGAAIRAELVKALSALPLSGAVDVERLKLLKRWR